MVGFKDKLIALMFPFRELFSSLDELKRRWRSWSCWTWWWSDSSAALANRDNPVETEGESKVDGGQDDADDPTNWWPDLIEDHGVIAADDEEVSGRRCAKGGDGSVLLLLLLLLEQLLKSNSSIPLMAKLFPHPDVIQKKLIVSM